MTATQQRLILKETSIQEGREGRKQKINKKLNRNIGAPTVTVIYQLCTSTPLHQHSCPFSITTSSWLPTHTHTLKTVYNPMFLVVGELSIFVAKNGGEAYGTEIISRRLDR